MLILGSTALLSSLFAARSDYYQPGSDLGYYLGLVGSVMMLTLLLYPLRKHVRILHILGPLKHWFRLHMFLGISGPILILLHSKYSFGSLNAGVALVCMLLVAGSGVIGRFIYRRIHHGLYGQRATLKDLHDSVNAASSEVNVSLSSMPAAAQRLRDYAAFAQRPASNILIGAFNFMSLGLRGKFIQYLARREVRRTLADRTQQQAICTLIADYIRAVQKEAQFRVYERLFSLWHILHAPFVYMLVISGIVHVVAVHMY